MSLNLSHLNKAIAAGRAKCILTCGVALSDHSACIYEVTTAKGEQRFYAWQECASCSSGGWRVHRRADAISYETYSAIHDAVTEHRVGDGGRIAEMLAQFEKFGLPSARDFVR